jgi:hypothetical protein
MRTRLAKPFASVLGDPMLRNGYALIVSATATQVLGVLYEIVAARTGPPPHEATMGAPREVGRGARLSAPGGAGAGRRR